MTHPPVFRPFRMPFMPATFALVAAWFALTPSLLPRAGAVQALVSAVAAILGYGLGAFLGWLLHDPRIGERTRRIAWKVFAVVGVIGSIILLFVSRRWQQDQRAEVGMPSASIWDIPITVVLGLVLFALLLMLCRAVRKFGRFLSRQISRLLPPRVSIAVGSIATVWIVVVLVNAVVVGQIGGTLDKLFLAINDEFSTDVAAPEESELSAGPGSLVTWESLGRQGRVFIANAPTDDAISEFTGEDAVQPIRVYVGSEGSSDLQAQANTAVEELVRTGAFNRAVINVATGTGRGWVNENSARALEYMWGGNTATVSIQYSYLPSWVSFLVDGARAQDAGRSLFEAVYAYWLTLPEDSRPKLVVSGESLGSFGGEAAFSGAQDIASRTSGVLWVGPTANNTLWNTFTTHRDSGSLASLPVFEGGQTVRFSESGDTWDGDGTWEEPRVGYLQHANDPITWLDFATVYQRPDFLSETRGTGVPDHMFWMPVITMLQIGGDLVAPGVPDGQGHEFGQSPARAWAQILPSEGWTDSDTNRLVAQLAILQDSDL
ncbi:alpha/beta hydrolase [Changpingibacter yushuensis]|uniref:alpha/beta hydrolase n=2 Tax=Changpingibacter yushuensis TaxID=2758440 RepID=UPI00165DD250|nr:alpha/beta-hydrolase family protein [Changpingibacter yushuensis]